MKMAAHAGAVLWLLVALLPTAALAAELEQGVYTAGVINFPTALNQATTHTLHGTIELTDIAKPDLSPYNFRYGFQYGAFQLLADVNWALEPKREFDYGEVKAKLQVLSLDEYRSYLALGLLGRGIRHSDERKWRIDDRPASLFIVSTFELFPFDRWGGFLLNFYLDNRFVSMGTKVQIYQSIQFVGEVERLHSTERKDKDNARAGIGFEGLHNFYFQLLWTDQGKHALAQIGAGF